MKIFLRQYSLQVIKIKSMGLLITVYKKVQKGFPSKKILIQKLMPTESNGLILFQNSLPISPLK
jgi:hypothetical protein